MNWYNFEPADTLFFKGAGPMNMGENHTATANFPPPARTLEGALRTTILKQNKIPIDQYYANSIDGELLDTIGPADKKAGFSVIGPLFELNKTIYVPAPYSWFFDKDDEEKEKVKIYKSRLVNSRLIKTSLRNLFWAKGEQGELDTLGGKWITLSDLYSQNNIVFRKEIHDFYHVENRTGIALDSNRSVRESHLYSFSHARLNKNINLIFGVDKDLPISDKGILKLGAEQRFGLYSKIPDINFNNGSSGLFISISQTAGTEQANESIVATGKIQYQGGWDMKKGFHKPMTGFFPPGSVFNDKLNDNFIQI
jgi:CRISPR-associated protein Cmr3